MDHTGIIGQFKIQDEIKSFQPGDNRSGRRAEILVKTDNLRVILVTMNAGAELAEHDAPGPITIHTLTGRFTVAVNGTESELDAGNLIAVHSSVKHSVRAVQPGAFLLTIGWPGDREQTHPTAAQ